MSPTAKNVAKYREFAKLPIGKRIDSARPLVYKMVNSVVHPNDADDVAQLVFVDLLENDAKWSPERGCYNTWVGWRVRRVLSCHWRERNNVHDPVEFGEFDGYAEPCGREREAPDAIGRLEQIEYAQKSIKGIFEILSYRQREVLWLRFGMAGEPHTLKEIGEKLGVSHERVRQIQAKALDTIRRRCWRIAEGIE